MKKQRDIQDDGRIVADMSALEGPNPFSLRRFGKKDAVNGAKKSDDSEMSPEDRGVYLKAAMLSTLLIASVFIVSCALFILFCQHVWFR